MAKGVRPLNEITEDAMRILCREIGIVNTVRFINQFTTGFGNYTEERKEQLGDLTLDDITSQIKQARER